MRNCFEWEIVSICCMTKFDRGNFFEHFNLHSRKTKQNCGYEYFYKRINWRFICYYLK